MSFIPVFEFLNVGILRVPTLLLIPTTLVQENVFLTSSRTLSILALLYTVLGITGVILSVSSLGEYSPGETVICRMGTTNVHLACNCPDSLLVVLGEENYLWKWLFSPEATKLSLLYNTSLVVCCLNISYDSFLENVSVSLTGNFSKTSVDILSWYLITRSLVIFCMWTVFISLSTSVISLYPASWSLYSGKWFFH